MPEETAASKSERLILSGQIMRDARLQRGWSQTELGRQIHAHGYRVASSPARVSKWERGRAPIPPLALPHLEAVLGIELPR